MYVSNNKNNGREEPFISRKRPKMPIKIFAQNVLDALTC